MSYTYLLGWSKHNKFYYGVRFAKGCHPNDLWISYFTSSKYVKEFRKHYGEPDIIQVRRTFDNTASARLWEEKVLKRLNVIKREDFLNRTDNRVFAPKPGPKTEQHKQNMRGPRPHVSQKGAKNNAFLGVIYTPFGTFENTTEAALVEDVDRTTIGDRINSNEYPEYYRSAA